jgi:hypothetical protein
MDWEGLPYADMILAGFALWATAASGGAGVPLAIAAIGALATVPSAADQIVECATGEGFLTDQARTALLVIATVSTVADMGVGARSAYKYATTNTRALVASTGVPTTAPSQIAPASNAATRAPSGADLKVSGTLGDRTSSHVSAVRWAEPLVTTADGAPTLRVI